MYIRNLRKPSATKNVYKFSSSKNGTLIICESSLERDCCFHLEYSPDVANFQSQPEGFYYTLGSKFNPYTPDFLVQSQDGSEYFIEVKPLNKTFSEEFRNSFILKKNAALEIGKKLILVTDVQIRKSVFLYNLKLIHRYRGWTDNRCSATKILDKLNLTGTMCIRSLADSLNLPVGLVVASVLRLICLGQVSTSLDTNINEMSVIQVNRYD